jgi:predicted NBD/HSP70 family sugar kinase
MEVPVGIDIGGSKMLMLADVGGRRIEHSVATGFDATARAITGAIATFLANLPGEPASVGIAVPGLVRNGCVEDSDVLPGLVGWSPAAIRADLAAAVINDAEAALIEEAADLGDAATAAIVVVGTGIGAAFQIDGRTCRGVSGWAGELGFAPMWQGNEVRTLDQMASGAAIRAELGLDPAVIHARCAEGDEHVIGVIAAAGTTLGLALATVVNLINPARVSLFGGTLRYPGYVDAALAAARRHAHPRLLADCTIRTVLDERTLVAQGAMRWARQAGLRR